MFRNLRPWAPVLRQCFKMVRTFNDTFLFGAKQRGHSGRAKGRGRHHHHGVHEHKDPQHSRVIHVVLLCTGDGRSPPRPRQLQGVSRSGQHTRMRRPRSRLQPHTRYPQLPITPPHRQAGGPEPQNRALRTNRPRRPRGSQNGQRFQVPATAGTFSRPRLSRLDLSPSLDTSASRRRRL
jgi:hypothetical protein